MSAPADPEVTPDPEVTADAAAIAARAESELEQLVAISSPSGDVPGAERAIALCQALLPEGARIERPVCSTAGCAPDLLATVMGWGERRLLVLGHVDTVIPTAAPSRCAVTVTGSTAPGPPT